MNFSDYLNTYNKIDTEAINVSYSDAQVKAAIEHDTLSHHDLAVLLSSNAENYLESMAQRAHGLTMQYFGPTMQLYTPLYLANYCDNHCVYCGFKAQNDMDRKKLSMDDIKKEAAYLSKQGFQHILLLTGSSRSKTPVSYIRDTVSIIKDYFSAIAIEVYAMKEEEYKELVDAGVDGLTLYQEVYDKEIYQKVHLKGPKSVYDYRLNAPDRAARAGIRQIGIGALLGLADWRKEAFIMAIHADYLMNKYPDLEVSISIPRLRPQEGGYKGEVEVSDKNIVQIITALRIFLPRLGITVSTREDNQFRENLIPLGVTKMSAGSTTEVGGHTQDDKNTSQFEIADKRDLSEIITMLKSKNYQPILHDWMHI